MQINKTDVIWNFFATFLKIASGVILLPFILKLLPVEEVGLWTIFMSVTILITLLDFGFNSSFTRNITYIFSGIKELKTKGVSNKVDSEQIDYGLLKGTIVSMRWFYSRVSIILFILLSTIGTYYIHLVLLNYNGDKRTAFIAWGLLCVINTYYLYTLYYDCLLQGKGLIKVSKQIIVFSQIIFIISATILLLCGFGLIAIISAQLIYVLLTRLLSYKVFFTKDLKLNLNNSIPKDKKYIIKAIYPNAVKMGLTTLGGFLIQRSAVFIGSLYLPLSDIASYGITKQLLDILAAVSSIFVTTYYPLIAKHRVDGLTDRIKQLFLKGTIFSFTLFCAGAAIIYFSGSTVLHLIGSKTELVSKFIILIASFATLVEMNITNTAGILLTKNEVPFLKPSLISGLATAIFIFIFCRFTFHGLLGLFLAPAIVQTSYQGWKWPYEVIKELDVSLRDIKQSFYSIMNTHIFFFKNKSDKYHYKQNL